MNQTQVTVKSIPVSRWMERYHTPEKFVGACEACPDYGRVWSCPPGVPEARGYFSPYQTAYLIGVKVVYDAETRAAALDGARTDEVRQATYGRVKRLLMETLLALESAFPGSVTVAAGRCELCERCTRPDALPCRTPERRRYSFSAFGFDLGRIAEEELGLKLLWSGQRLPEYNVAIAAFLTRD
ncbi:MAG: hypothetical protein EOM52_10485 [Clostridia bacterium]|nr:hypothetical protein [Clostridia bacterium]